MGRWQSQACNPNILQRMGDSEGNDFFITMHALVEAHIPTFTLVHGPLALQGEMAPTEMAGQSGKGQNGNRAKWERAKRDVPTNFLV